jgi:CHASE3 domain sensor protein
VKRAKASRLVKAEIVIPAVPGSLDVPFETVLKRRITGGFVVAVLLTILMGAASWRSTWQSANDADWVVHTYAVMETLKVMLQHVVEVETSARTFALIGQDPLLAHYRGVRDMIAGDEDELRRLTADNPNQQRRLDVLEPQVRAGLDFAATMVAKRRQTGAAAGPGEVLQTEGLMDAVRITTQEMQAEEAQLLNYRTRRIEEQRRLTSFIMAVGVLVGAGLLTLSRFAINREIAVSSGARASLSTLNAELEHRVEQRTAALQSEVVEHKGAKEQLAGQAEELSRTGKIHPMESGGYEDRWHGRGGCYPWGVERTLRRLSARHRDAFPARKESAATCHSRRDGRCGDVCA